MIAEDELAIRTVIARYCHACDDGDATGVASLFHEDADYQVGDKVTSGRAAIEAHFVEVAPVASIGKHVATNTVVTSAGPHQADAISDWLYLVSDNGLVPLAAGRYIDRFEHRNGQWRFARRRIDVFGA